MGDHAERKDDLRELAGELNKETYKDCHTLIQEKIKDKSFLNGYLADMRSIMRDYESLVKRLGEEALAVIERYGLTPVSFKGKSRSWATAFGKWSQGNLLPPKDTFKDTVDDLDLWFTSSDRPACAEELYAELRPVAQELIDSFGEPWICYNTAVQSSKYIYALGILADIGRRIEEYEREHNTLLLSDTAGILNAVISESDAPFIYEKLGTRINHFMIDEFQDTSNLQWRNFEPLIRESLSRDLTNLIVGDVKQSIYRWRNSDWSLLNERVKQQYNSSQYSESTMKTNYRSCAQVVEFNNRVFGVASEILHNRFKDEVEASAFKEFDVKIEEVYAHIGQHVCASKQELPGRVSVAMWYPSRDGFESDALKRIPDLLRELQDRGYKPGDIAFLVRTAKEGVAIVDLLLELKKNNTDSRYSYDVISNESLLIKNSPTINLLIGVLRYIQDSTLELNGLLVLYEYYHKDVSALLNYLEHKGDIERYFDRDFRAVIEQVRKKPLFEMCESILSYFATRGNQEGELV